MFSRFNVRGVYFVPGYEGTYCGVDAFGFSFVVTQYIARRVRQEFGCRVRDRLPTANALTRQFEIAERVATLRDVSRYALYVVRQSYRLTSGEGHRVVFCLIRALQAPFRILRSVGSLGVRCVEVDAVRSEQLVRTVRIGRWFVFDANFHHPVVRDSRFLVVPVRGVGFRALRSRFNVVAARVFRVSIRYVVANPWGGACVPDDHVVRRFFRVSVFCRLRRVDLRVGHPSFVRCRVLRLVNDYRVGVHFVDVVIRSHCGVRSVRVPITPPFPDRFAQLCP